MDGWKRILSFENRQFLKWKYPLPTIHFQVQTAISFRLGPVTLLKPSPKPAGPVTSPAGGTQIPTFHQGVLVSVGKGWRTVSFQLGKGETWKTNMTRTGKSHQFFNRNYIFRWLIFHWFSSVMLVFGEGIWWYHKWACTWTIHISWCDKRKLGRNHSRFRKKKKHGNSSVA